ncbi:MAG: ATP cone domain-containing protein [Patescibacteria group bacterium]
MAQETPYVVKANGKKEPFDILKLEHSLRNADATPDTLQKITKHIIQELEDGMTTQDIYKHAFSLLHNIERRSALKYSMRRAVMDLGPSGFPFERLVAEIFKQKGYEAVTDKIVEGSCSDHEVDVVAWKPDSLIMCEAKFHGQLGLKSDLKTILYVKARFDDLSKKTYTFGAEPQPLSEGWLVTNTKFTITAIKYAECQGMKAIGWNYPLDGNLHDLIDSTGLHPLTCLHSLSDHDKKELLSKNIILCKNLVEDPSILVGLGLNDANIEAVLEEIALVGEMGIGA